MSGVLVVFPYFVITCPPARTRATDLDHQITAPEPPPQPTLYVLTPDGHGQASAHLIYLRPARNMQRHETENRERIEPIERPPSRHVLALRMPSTPQPIADRHFDQIQDLFYSKNNSKRQL